MRLVDRHVARRSVDLTRRGVNYELGIRLLGGAENVERPDDVRLDVCGRRLVRPRDRNQCREVEDDVPSSRSCVRRVAVANVAENDLHVAARRRFVEPPPGAERVVFDERTYLGAQLEETLAEVAADETARTGHEHRPSAPAAHSPSTSASACW